MARRKLDISSLPSNNQENIDKNLEVITTGRVKTAKGSGLASEVRNIGNSLFEEIILPAVKSAIVDFFSNGVNMVMFGRESMSRRGGRTNYNKMSRRRQPNRSRQAPNRRRAQQVEEVFEDVFFDNRNDAEAVLGRMMELIADYGWATVGDLYSLVGLSTNYTHERYAWDDLRQCRVQYTTEGYVIDFPEAEYVK